MLMWRYLPLQKIYSSVKSNLTSWCNQILSKDALNAFTEQASTTEFGKLFVYLQYMQKKSVYVDRSGKYGLEVYSRLVQET